MEVRGFCRNKEQESEIRRYGVSDKAIFMDGRGAETFDRCFATYRGRAGTLVIAHDLRVLGGTKRLVAEIMAKLERARIQVVDLANPGDCTVAELVQRANVAISGARFAGDRPRARRQGRMGGLGKGRAAEDNRNHLAPRWLVDRIVDHRSIPWKQKLEILAPNFSEPTLRRHYGARAAAKKV